MDNQDFATMQRQDMEVIFTSSAITGILSAHPALLDSPDVVAKKALAISRATIKQQFPEKEEQPAEQTE